MFNKRVICFMAVLAIGAVFALPRQVAAEDPKPEGKILYVDTSEPDKTYLATITPDGKDRQRLTPGYSNIVFPKFSQSTGWIGFTNKTPEFKSEVYLLSRDGKKIKKIFDGANLEGFSPDGKSLMYISCDQNASLYIYSIDDRTALKISDTLRVTAADWSPKGNWIAVSVLENDGTNDLYMISTRAQGFRRLTDTPGVNESFPVFTNDGKVLAFISDRYGHPNEIEYMDLENRKLQRPLIQGMFPSLSPSNKWISFEIGKDVGACKSNGLETWIVTRGRTPNWIQ